MTTAQQLVILFLAILSLVSFTGQQLSKKEENIILFNILGLITHAMCFIIIIVSLTITSEYIEKVKGKCPEYERIENVYKLKENK